MGRGDTAKKNRVYSAMIRSNMNCTMKDGITDFSSSIFVTTDENFVINAEISSMNYT